MKKLLSKIQMFSALFGGIAHVSIFDDGAGSVKVGQYSFGFHTLEELEKMNPQKLYDKTHKGKSGVPSI